MRRCSVTPGPRVGSRIVAFLRDEGPESFELDDPALAVSEG